MVQAVTDIRKAKIENLSLDLILGLPGQTMASWEDTLRKALSLNPDHISCYGLKVEENTPLALHVADGLVLPDDDAQADLYLRGVELLRQSGFRQYEISNFAKPGIPSIQDSERLKPFWASGPGPTPTSAAGGMPIPGIWRGTSVLWPLGACRWRTAKPSPPRSRPGNTSSCRCVPCTALRSGSTAAFLA